jgi:hypothetical protein
VAGNELPGDLGSVVKSKQANSRKAYVFQVVSGSLTSPEETAGNQICSGANATELEPYGD